MDRGPRNLNPIHKSGMGSTHSIPLLPINCDSNCVSKILVDYTSFKPPDPKTATDMILSNTLLESKSDLSSNDTAKHIKLVVNDINEYVYNFNRTFSDANVTEIIKNCSSFINDSDCLSESGDKVYNFWALSLLIFPVLTLFGNVLVIMSVARERTLQTATNYFIVSLAVADLLVAVIVMPFGVYYLVSSLLIYLVRRLKYILCFRYVLYY